MVEESGNTVDGVSDREGDDVDDGGGAGEGGSYYSKGYSRDSCASRFGWQ